MRPGTEVNWFTLDLARISGVYKAWVRSGGVRSTLKM